MKSVGIHRALTANDTAVQPHHGWLIFALPPSEVAVHPSDDNNVHELFLMCDDVHALIAEMTKKKVKCSPVEERLGVYQPKHPSPIKAKKT